ncbi:MAG: four-carbon acid sugar kinase family protein [Janthinobacterium lividum]
MSAAASTPLPRRLLAFYGDDFTGSTDALDVTAKAGLSSVLFLRTPDPALLDRFADARVVGIAGIARSQTPAWMRAELPAVYDALHATGAAFVHYKVCSTFDSAPEVGNIGEATRIGLAHFPARPVPITVGAPALRRYVTFGNLFAGMGTERYRIDRHPVMSRHPVTPMHEADLRRHLALQAELSVGLMDLPALDVENVQAAWRAMRIQNYDAVLFDTVDERSLRQVGLLLHEMIGDAPLFAIGSSGFEYALVSAWRSLGLLDAAPPAAPITPAERLFAISGSCSPVTAAQIARATQADGFISLHVDPLSLLESGTAIDATVSRAVALLAEGRDVLLHTAEGPDDMVSPPSGDDCGAFNDRLGVVLGHLLGDVLARSGVRRAVVAGGDTSSHATQQLGLHALTVAAPLAPGCPLCVGHSDDPALAGLEIALKGGQMGQDDFFRRAKTGVGSQP